MSVETSAQYISQLQAEWPSSRDLIREGDDHIRKIKEVLIRTFPNANTTMTATFGFLNGLSNAMSLSNQDVIFSGSVRLSPNVGMSAAQGKITDLNDPDSPGDAATKGYVDAQISAVSSSAGAGTQSSKDYTDQQTELKLNEAKNYVNTQNQTLESRFAADIQATKEYAKGQVDAHAAAAQQLYVSKATADATYYSTLNRPYTVGVGAPSGGLNGDLYFQVS